MNDKRRARGNETRSRILKSVITIIATLGLGNSTLDRVAEHAGVSRALVVFHFKSKKKLIQEGLDYLGRIYSQGWDSVAASSEDFTTMEKILCLINYDIRFVRDNREYLSVWAAFWGESKGSVLYREQAVPRDQRYTKELKELLARYITEEGYEIQNLHLIVSGLNAMQFGIWIESHLDPKPDDYQTGMAAVQLFLANTFPKKPLPEIPTIQ
ncbi:MAG: TetR/AcrR family transcriptional regulator [Gammaproteobacteria bacterium]|nr:TetR/AcrR family transcriptional regulator [Gammaproteobacteria bacterium]